MPTPLVSWAVREGGAAGGVVITASHNPAHFNGFKIKAPWGGSATEQTTLAVEALVDAHAPRRATELPASVHEGLGEAAESYRRQVASFVDLERIRAARARVVVDPMHGSGGRWVESFLGGGALEVETIRAERDTLFGGVAPEPIDRNLAPLKRRVAETRALVGLATDGDADRVGAVGDGGATMTMHEVVPLILLHLARARGARRAASSAPSRSPSCSSASPRPTIFRSTRRPSASSTSQTSCSAKTSSSAPKSRAASACAATSPSATASSILCSSSKQSSPRTRRRPRSCARCTASSASSTSVAATSTRRSRAASRSSARSPSTRRTTSAATRFNRSKRSTAPSSSSQTNHGSSSASPAPSPSCASTPKRPRPRRCKRCSTKAAASRR